jgi:hypothetical protein
VKKSRIVVQRNSRLFLPLMVNVGCRCRINFKPDQAAGGIENAMMSDFTPSGHQVLALARQEAERFNHHMEYVHVPLLAPTEDILDAYKKHRGDRGLYEWQFLDLMKERRIEDKASREMLNGACLLCSEEKPHHCHRRLVAEYLKIKWGDVEIEHIP